MSAFSAQIIADGAAGYWRNGEASGVTVQDAHPTNNNDATVVGAPTMGVAGGLLTDSDKAIQLNGTSQYLSVLDANPLDLGNTFTLMCLVKRLATGQMGLMSKGSSYRLEVAATGSSSLIRLRNAGTATIVQSTGGFTDLTKFHLIHAQKNGSTTAKIYLDGVDVSGAFTDSTITDSAVALILGANTAAAQFLNGILDECAIFPTFLSAAQIANHWILARGLPIGIATETDEAMPQARQKHRAIGIASESDASLTTSKSKSKAITRTDETDAAQALQRQKQRTLAPAEETDAAQALSHRKEKAIAPATEADVAAALAAQKQKAISPASESDTAEQLDAVKQRAIGPASEVDTAEQLDAEKHKGIGFAEETDEARALARAKSQPIGPATESDAAGALSRTKVLPISPAVETDQAMLLTVPGKTIVPIGIAQETDAAMPLTQPTQPVPTPTPRPRGTTGISPMLPERERRILVPKIVPIGIAEEHDEALVLSFEKRPSRNQIDEEDLLAIGAL